MPEPKGRKHRRDRERERRRSREPAILTDEERTARAETREAQRAARPAPTVARSAPPAYPELPGLRVRITGAMVGIITMLGAAYIVIAGILNGSGIDSVISVGAGVVMLGVGTFVVALVLFPVPIRNFVRRGG